MTGLRSAVRDALKKSADDGTDTAWNEAVEAARRNDRGGGASLRSCGSVTEGSMIFESLVAARSALISVGGQRTMWRFTRNCPVRRSCVDPSRGTRFAVGGCEFQ